MPAEQPAQTSAQESDPPFQSFLPEQYLESASVPEAHRDALYLGGRSGELGERRRPLLRQTAQPALSHRIESLEVLLGGKKGEI